MHKIKTPERRMERTELAINILEFSFSGYGSCLYKQTIDTSADGADAVSGVASRDECLQACEDQYDTCKAVEYSPQFGCYMHTAEVTATRSNAGVTLYEVLQCSKFSFVQAFRLEIILFLISQPRPALCIVSRTPTELLSTIEYNFRQSTTIATLQGTLIQLRPTRYLTKQELRQRNAWITASKQLIAKL